MRFPALALAVLVAAIPIAAAVTTGGAAPAPDPATEAAAAPGPTPDVDALAGLGPAVPDRAPGDASADIEAIVQLGRAAGPATLKALAARGDVLARFEVVDAVHMRLPAADLDAVEALPGVLRTDRVEPLALSLDSSRSAIGVGPEVWSRVATGHGTSVAIVDTGVDGGHPGLADRIRLGLVFPGDGGPPEPTDRPTDADGHGTHVAGIVAGTGEGDDLGAPDRTGVAPGAGLVSLDVSADFDTATALAAFDWVHDHHAEHNITVLHNSWGRLDVRRPYDPGDPLLRAIATLVEEDGLVVVFAASNAGPDPGSLSMEAEDPNVLTVGATDDAGRLAAWSSRGPVPLGADASAPWTKPDVVAPGIAVTSARAGGGYATLSGTSMAAPHVTGVVALVRAAAPHLGPFDVMDAVREGALDVGAPGTDNATGWGVVQAPRALALAAARADPSEAGFQVRTVRDGGRLVVDVGGPGAGPVRDPGHHPARAEGTFNVGALSDRLHVRAVWSSAPAPVRLVLEDPEGEVTSVPGSDQGAMRVVRWPTTGTWTWRLVADGAASLALDYEVTAAVHGLAPAGAAPAAPVDGDAAGGEDAAPSAVAAPDDGLALLLAAAAGMVAAAGGRRWTRR